MIWNENKTIISDDLEELVDHICEKYDTTIDYVNARNQETWKWKEVTTTDTKIVGSLNHKDRINLSLAYGNYFIIDIKRFHPGMANYIITDESDVNELIRRGGIQ